jgi:hypothetical protein
MFRQCSFGVGRTLVLFLLAPGPRCGPWPLIGGLAKPGPDWVVEDVGDRAGKALVPVDQTGIEAAPEEVTGALVAPVEALCVYPAQTLNAGRQSGAGALDDEVVVVVHEAERNDGPSMESRRVGEYTEEGDAVNVVADDLAAVHAARGDVVDPVRQVASADARHPWTLGITSVRNRPGDAFGALRYTYRHTDSSASAEPRGSDPRGSRGLAARRLPPVVRQARP